MQSTYKHRLLSTVNSTRVLILEPASNPTAPLHCSLEEICLNSPTIPDYNALSYAWDSQTPTCPIICDNEVLLITPNCEAALRRLRRLFDSQRLWIDSICIDQTSSAERSQQVALMGDIYKRAEFVVVWLGEGDTKVEIAMQRLNGIGELCVPTDDKSKEKKTKSGAALELLLGTEVKHKSQDPLGPVWELSWFHRIWTVQEVTLPSAEKVVVRYGAMSFPWVFILLTADFLRIAVYKFGRWDEATRLQNRISAMLRQKRDPESQRTILAADKDAASPYQGVLQILVAMRPKKATDPKDKVFALMSVLKELDLRLPSADYQKSLERIYIETAVACIKNAGNLDVLYEAPSKSRRHGLPSWVPDWSDETSNSSEHKKYAVETNLQTAGRNTLSWSFSQDYKRLIVSGKIVDSIAANGDVLEYEMDFSLDLLALHVRKTGFKDIMERFQPPIAILREWVRLSSRYTTYPSGETAENAFKSTLLDGGFIKDAISSDTPSDESYRHWLDFMKRKEEDILPSLRAIAKGQVSQSQRPTAESSYTRRPNDTRRNENQAQAPYAAGMHSFLALSTTEASRFHYEILRKDKGKAFFTTTNGYFGLAIGEQIRPGDRIALIPGLEVPFVLRPVGDGFELVTYCYIHGSRDGELWMSIARREDIVLL